MADYSVAIHSKLLHLRYKYGDDLVLNGALDKIVWFSFPVVYPYYSSQVKRVLIDFEKAKARRKRIRKYIRLMVDCGKPIFLVSLTFGDTLDSTSADTRKRYVRDWLNSRCFDYYACVDYGDLCGREHYHAIATFNFDLSKDDRGYFFVPSDFAWSKGFSSFRLIASSSKDVYRSLNYAFKCSNYAFKRADNVVKPFHKRKSKKSFDWSILDDDSFL